MSVFSESSLDVEAKSHQGSYYSELNAPEFYGTTKVVIKIGDSFDVNDAKYRIFARDFEDGDLTKKIELVSNTVDTTKTGSYTVQYAIIASKYNNANCSCRGNGCARYKSKGRKNIVYPSIDGQYGKGRNTSCKSRR